MSKHSHYKVGCDAHKHFSVFAVLDRRGRVVKRDRVNHEPGAIRTYLSQFPGGTPVALETVGNWYWIVDEIACPGRTGQGSCRMCAPSGPCRQGQSDDGLRAQDGQARCGGAGHVAPPWPSPPGQAMALCPPSGSRPANCVTSASCLAPGCSQAARTVAFSKIRTTLCVNMR